MLPETGSARAVSIGVTEYQCFEAVIEALLPRAELALYSAKHGVRNRTVLRVAAQETEAA